MSGSTGEQLSPTELAEITAKVSDLWGEFPEFLEGFKNTTEYRDGTWKDVMSDKTRALIHNVWYPQLPGQVVYWCGINEARSVIQLMNRLKKHDIEELYSVIVTSKPAEARR
ncbi:Fc.00g099670.m01.CDS01 [Cosmosporella sp. VM-42]